MTQAGSQYERNKEEHAAGEKFPCASPHCGAKVGEPCKTRDGDLAYHPHHSRQVRSKYVPPALKPSPAMEEPGAPKPQFNPVTGAVIVRSRQTSDVTASDDTPVERADDIFRRALDLRDRPRNTQTDVLIGAAIDGALRKIDVTELVTVLKAAGTISPADPSVTDDEDPPF